MTPVKEIPVMKKHNGSYSVGDLWYDLGAMRIYPFTSNVVSVPQVLRQKQDS
jgi:hypothetical protein